MRPKVRIILGITLLWNNFRSSFDKSMHALSHQSLNLAAYTYEWTNEGGGDCRVQTMKTQLWTASRIPTLSSTWLSFWSCHLFSQLLTFTLMFYKLQDLHSYLKESHNLTIVQFRGLYWADETWDPTLDSTCSVLHEINLTLLSHCPMHDLGWNF